MIKFPQDLEIIIKNLRIWKRSKFEFAYFIGEKYILN